MKMFEGKRLVLNLLASAGTMVVFWSLPDNIPTWNLFLLGGTLLAVQILQFADGRASKE